MADWPTHPDGRPMKLGEMTKEQRRAQFVDAAQRVKEWFEKPEVQAGLAASLNATKPQ